MENDKLTIGEVCKFRVGYCLSEFDLDAFPGKSKISRPCTREALTYYTNNSRFRNFVFIL